MSEQAPPKSSGSLTCEEASLFIPSTATLFVPCGQPATQSVYHKNDSKTYRMCEMCAGHNVRNRGAVLVPEDAETLAESRAKNFVAVKPQADDLAADAAASQARKSTSSTVTLAEVRALAEQQLVLEVEVETLEAQLDAKKKELKDVAEYKLPELLLDAGLPSLTLSDGSTISVQDNIFASIGDDNRDAAHAWLRAAGHGDIIKNVVSVTFGKGEDDYAKLLIHNIHVMADNNALKYGTLAQQEQVHNATLRAFVKERLKAGDPLPLETFKVFEGKIAKIKKSKRRDA